MLNTIPSTSDAFLPKTSAMAPVGISRAKMQIMNHDWRRSACVYVRPPQSVKKGISTAAMKCRCFRNWKSCIFQMFARTDVMGQVRYAEDKKVMPRSSELSI